jgi:hypothetical protein
MANQKAKKTTASAPKGTKKAGLAAFTRRELRLELPRLGPMSPGLVWINEEPETEDGLCVLGTNMAGLWFVLADDGSIHLVDDVERELGTKVFADVDAFAKELARQNP